jgi:hypothetical protein
MATVDPRITRLLNQLEDPGLTAEQIAQIKVKIGIVEAQGMKA